MDDNEEDGVYSDDDLDALPENALSELEFKAVQSTQQKNQFITRGQHQQDHQSLPFLPKPPQQILPVQPRYDGRKAQQYAQSVDYPQQPSSDYGNLDDTDIGADLLDAGDFTNLADESQRGLVNRSVGDPTQRDHWRQHGYGVPPDGQLGLLERQSARRPVVAGDEEWQGAHAHEGYNGNGVEINAEMLDDHTVQREPAPTRGAEQQRSNAVDALQAQIEKA